MAPLNMSLAVGLLALATPADPQSVSTWRPYVSDASIRCGIPTLWIERVMQAESGGRTMRAGRPIRSRVGAMGLMQLMPPTWAMMRSTLDLGNDPDDPRDNILAGACYLRMMYDRFGYPGLFAAYNAGPQRYADHLATGRALPGETVAYLETVGGHVHPRMATPAEPPRETLFVVRRQPGTEAATTASNPPSSLFVVSGDGS